MCVIFVADKARPDDDMVKQGFEANNSGAGIAWQELNEAGTPVVKWEKGLGLEEIQEYVRTMPLPFVAHFRIPSCGGSSKELCHPFPITEQVGLSLAGETLGDVLFHNGHWSQWETKTMEAVIRHNIRVPKGKWSDTRALAWFAAHFGTAILDFINEKTVVIGPAEIEIFGTGWSRINDVWCSNSHWQRGHYSHSYNGGGFVMCREQRCSKNRYGTSMFCFEHQHLGAGDQGGSSDNRSFQGGQAVTQPGSTESSGVQGGSEGARDGGGSGTETPQEGKEVVPPQKLLGPAPYASSGRSGASSGSRPHGLAVTVNDKLVVTGDGMEDWRAIRRWVRSLQARTSEPSRYGDEVDRAKRHEERAKGMTRVGPM